MRLFHHTAIAAAVLSVITYAITSLGGCGDRDRTRSAKQSSPPGKTPLAVPRADKAEATKPQDSEAQQPIDPEAIVIGLDADMSSSSAEAGEAIRRGAVLAIDEINEAGGVLGKKLQLVVKDHRGNPARGVDNIELFAKIPNLAAVLGGLHTFVAAAELDPVHRHEIVFLIPWAAGTALIDNDYKPSFAFRVSVRDEFAGTVMVDHAMQNGCKKVGLLLERTLWGRSNHKAINAALTRYDGASTLVEWFSLGNFDISEQITALVTGGAECIILVSNPSESLAAIETMAKMPTENHRPIISHWGIMGKGRSIVDRLRPYLDTIDLSILQSFSFFNPRFPERAERVVEMYCRQFGCRDRSDIFSPNGTAHAYELIHLLAIAITRAGATDGPSIRDALEKIPSYRGLIRDYAPPFTADRHDALTVEDLQMCRLDDNGALIPVTIGDRSEPR